MCDTVCVEQLTGLSASTAALEKRCVWLEGVQHHQREQKQVVKVGGQVSVECGLDMRL